MPPSSMSPVDCLGPALLVLLQYLDQDSLLQLDVAVVSEQDRVCFSLWQSLFAVPRETA